MNTGGTFRVPQFMATLRKIWSCESVPWLNVVTCARLDAVAFLGQGGLVAVAAPYRGSAPALFAPPRACNSRSTVNRFSRVCTYVSGTVGLMKASICTGRSTFKSPISSRVCGDSELSFSLVTSQRRS